jgi:hypothetical protein
MLDERDRRAGGRGKKKGRFESSTRGTCGGT